MQVGTSYRHILQISLPIIIGSLSQALLNIIDTAFLGRVDEVTLAAGAIGGTFYLIFSLIVMAMALGGQIIIARRAGESNNAEIGKTFNQANYLLFTFSVVLFVLIVFITNPLMKLIISNQEVYSKSIDYLNYRSFGILFVSLATSFRSLYIGLSKTTIITYVTVIMSLFNAVFDYYLIFGHGPFPEMGIKGAALASSLAEVLACVVFILFTRLRHDFRKFSIFNFPKPDYSIIRKIIQLSYPSVFQYLLSIVCWFTFFIIIEKRGQDMLASSNVIRSVLMLVMFPAWGFAATANTMVSNLLGQQKPNELFTVIRKIILLNYVWVLLLLPFLIIFPEFLLRIITNEQHIIDMSINSLYVVFLALVVFTLAANLVHALQGTGDTKTAFFIELIALLIYLAYTIIVSVGFQASLEIIWFAESIYWVIIGLLSYWRLKSGKWQKIVV